MTVCKTLLPLQKRQLVTRLTRTFPGNSTASIAYLHDAVDGCCGKTASGISGTASMMKSGWKRCNSPDAIVAKPSTQRIQSSSNEKENRTRQGLEKDGMVISHAQHEQMSEDRTATMQSPALHAHSPVQLGHSQPAFLHLQQSPILTGFESPFSSGFSSWAMRVAGRRRSRGERDLSSGRSASSGTPGAATGPWPCTDCPARQSPANLDTSAIVSICKTRRDPRTDIPVERFGSTINSNSSRLRCGPIGIQHFS